MLKNNLIKRQIENKVNGSEIIPIEVKSGTNVNAKSLKIFREAYSPRVSVRFSLKNTRLDDDLQNISLLNVFLFEHLIGRSSEKCVKHSVFLSELCVRKIKLRNSKEK